MTGPSSIEPAPSSPAGIVLPPLPMSRVLPERLRFFYLVVLPVAGCVAAVASGGAIGRGWCVGIGIGLFLYHYLIWALHETERMELRFRTPGSVWARWSWLIPPLLVLLVVKGEWLNWLIEQTMLETGAFVAAVGILAMRKCAGEGKEAPWFLAIAVFVLPASILLVKLGAIWLSRRGGTPGWLDLAFVLAMGGSLAGHYRRLFPFISGGDQLVEPLSSSRRTVVMVVWFIILLIGALGLGR